MEKMEKRHIWTSFLAHGVISSFRARISCLFVFLLFYFSTERMKKEQKSGWYLRMRSMICAHFVLFEGTFSLDPT